MMLEYNQQDHDNAGFGKSLCSNCLRYFTPFDPASLPLPLPVAVPETFPIPENVDQAANSELQTDADGNGIYPEIERPTIDLRGLAQLALRKYPAFDPSFLNTETQSDSGAGTSGEDDAGAEANGDSGDNGHGINNNNNNNNISRSNNGTNGSDSSTNTTSSVSNQDVDDGSPSPYCVTYTSFDEAWGYLRQRNKSRGYDLVKRRTSRRRKEPADVYRVCLMCNRSGAPRHEGLGKRKRTSRKICCPFEVVALQPARGDRWVIVPVVDAHNHPRSTKKASDNSSRRRRQT